MTKKIFLTSAITMCIACPAMAEPTYTGNFPANGLMQADYTYTNAANSTNMDGVYEGSVNANAQYTDNYYTVSEGTYLPADAEATAPCTSGNFCPGLQNQVTYSATNNQGLNECPSGYGNSAEGSTANTDCYRTCAIANNGTTFTNIAHATAVSGNDYYNSTATDTCVPTACENGWHVKAATPDLMTLIGASEAGDGYTSNDYTGSDYDTKDMSNTIIANDPMAFAVDYGNKGKITGHGRCSKTTGDNNEWEYTNPTMFDVLTDETGEENAKHCYCQLDGYTPLNGILQTLSSSWVYYSTPGPGSASYCASMCAYVCATLFTHTGSNYENFRAAVFGSVVATPAMCEANTITINWSDTDATDVTANNAGTATYGSDIRTPVKAQTKKGKTFIGWRFSKPAN